MKIPSKEEIMKAANNCADTGMLLSDFPHHWLSVKYGFEKGSEWTERQLEPLITDLEMEKARKATRLVCCAQQKAKDINVPQSAEVVTLEECLDQWDGLPLGKDGGDWYPRKAVLRAMAEYASQFKAKSEALQAELDIRQWISVDDHWPKLEGWYLTFRKNKTGSFMCVAHHDGKPYPIELTGWHNVTHWMPLPSAPKEGHQ